jgi:hypothetical protein
MAMRKATIVLTVLLCGPVSWATAKEERPKRYNIEANLEAYPQDDPKTTLGSVIKAIESKNIDYLLAQLADPKFVDQRVRLHDGKFDEFVKETTDHLAADPTLLKQLKRILKSGEWQIEDTTASAFLKDNKDKRVYLKKIGQWWYFENRQMVKTKEKE